MDVLKRINLVLFILSLAFVATAQESSDEEYFEDDSADMLEVTIDYLSPYGSLRGSIDRSDLGFSFAFFKQTKSESFSHLGLQVSFFRIGSLSNVISSGGDSFTDVTNSNALTLRFMYRIYAPFYKGRLEPFLETGIGPHMLYTTTSTTFFDEQSSTDFTFEEADFGLSYNISAGTSFLVSGQFLIVAKVGLNGGTATSYLVANNGLQSTFPIDSFRRSTDRINYFTISLGGIYSF